MVASLASLALALLKLQDPVERAVFRVDAEVVPVDVFVGKNDRAIVGLGPEDFELYDDGVLQKVEFVSSDTIPIDVALVLDTSDSVAGAKLRQLQGAARAFLEALDGQDRVALITFSHFLRRWSELTSETSGLIEALDELEGAGATAWHDALYAGLKTVEGSSHRPVVLLFTDGEDTYSWLREENMMPLVQQSHAVLYWIIKEDRTLRLDLGENSIARETRWRKARQEHFKRTRFLRELTVASGGRLVERPDSSQLDDTFLEILAELKTRYVLAYRPSAPIREGWHELQVEVKVKGATVQARKGYFYERRP